MADTPGKTDQIQLDSVHQRLDEVQDAVHDAAAGITHTMAQVGAAQLKTMAAHTELLAEIGKKVGLNVPAPVPPAPIPVPPPPAPKPPAPTPTPTPPPPAPAPVIPPPPPVVLPKFTGTVRFESPSISPGAQPKVIASVENPGPAPWDGLFNIELRDSGGNKVYQKFIPTVFAVGRRDFTENLILDPTRVPAGTYRLSIGVFSKDWVKCCFWLDGPSMVVGGAAPPNPADPAVVRPPRRTANVGRSDPSITQIPGLPVPVSVDRSRIPAAITALGEIRSGNADACKVVYQLPVGWPNKDTGGDRTAEYYKRVTGDFVGTTLECLVWAALKWGVDKHLPGGEYLFIAQAIKESFLNQSAKGDKEVDSKGIYPTDFQSRSLLQIKRTVWGGWPLYEDSVPLACDYAGAMYAMKYYGHSWLGAEVAGDVWECIGAWFSGRAGGANDDYATQVKAMFLAQPWWNPTSPPTWLNRT